MADEAASPAATASAGVAAAPQNHYEPIEESSFAERLGNTSTEVSSVALGGRILGFSDEWFAPASDLLKVGPAPSMKGQFGPKGALFDGWETRRHNPTYDWVIVRLGPVAGGRITGFDVDTANFNGNEAPEVEIYGLCLTPDEEKAAVEVRENDDRWAPLLPRVPCKPSSRHLYALKDDREAENPIYTHIKLHMIPDGGIARFRVYGTIPPPAVGFGVSEQPAEDPKLNVLDLAHVLNGGRVVFTSDQHFGIGPNVLLPGRGKDMGDGWETKRSRAPGHKDWLIVKLGETGFLNYAEIDTAHFLGNFPESVELHATYFDGLQPPEDEEAWMLILPRSRTGPGRQHYFPLEGLDGKPFSHVRVTMHPDGGIKRVRIMGRRVAPLAGHMEPLPSVQLPAGWDKDLPDQPRTLSGLAGAASAALSSVLGSSPMLTDASPPPPPPKSLSLQHGFLGARHLSAADLPSEGPVKVQATPLTPATFGAYGDVIASPHASGLLEQGYKSANQGTAQKYEGLSDVMSVYPTSAQAQARIHIYRCQGFDSKAPFSVRVLERHQFTKQAFLPMSKTQTDAMSGQEGYLVIVAKNGPDDLPDLSTLAAFKASSEQGIAYGSGIWHHPMVSLGTAPTDFACVVHDSAIRPELNCDEVFYDGVDAAVVNM